MKPPLSGHILPTAATMVGVCMTVLSIVKLTHLSRDLDSWIDELLALDSLVFLASAMLSYGAIRSAARGLRLEELADKTFMAGLLLMGVVVCLLSFALG